MANLYISLYERKTERLVAFYYMHDNGISRQFAIKDSWKRAIAENKVCIDAKIDDYRFDLTYR